jgi:multidrug efflux pump subunit AcrA (membrane-fusion protein)
MSVRPSAAAFVATLALAVCGPLYTGSHGQLFPSAAHAQSKPRTSQGQPAQKSPTEQLRSQVETLINRLRGRDMPEGIVKSNGRIEATQVDVAAKYPGRLATLTVDEGDEVTAGQRVATISSPETEAQLRAAQAQVLKAKQALAEAVALIAQRKSDLDFTRKPRLCGRSIELLEVSARTLWPAP